ncbi:MAG: HK97 family phage prohead protease [Parvularculaceae bacterium]|nr:HK97 family phage prohead protease [Parvularculaceae bacterium]
MTQKLRIEGWAAIYSAADLKGDIVAPGAFAGSLGLLGPSQIKMLSQHASDTPIGRWLAFEERAKGLYAIGEITRETQAGAETAHLIEEGILDGLSIGFTAVKSEAVKGGRRILEAALWEVSIVTFPMAPAARLTVPFAASDEAAIADFAATVRRAARLLTA